MLAVLAAWLWAHRLRRVALAVLINTALGIVATTALKKVSRAAGGAFFGTPWHLTTGAPSGHAAISTMVFGVAGGLFAIRASGVARAAGVTLAAILIVGVDVTRVTLGYHSPGDVVTGLLLGTVFAALALHAARNQTRPWPPMLSLLALLAGTAALMLVTGIRFDSNAML